MTSSLGTFKLDFELLKDDGVPIFHGYPKFWEYFEWEFEHQAEVAFRVWVSLTKLQLKKLLLLALKASKELLLLASLWPFWVKVGWR